VLIPVVLLAATLTPFDQVVASERAFAAASLSKGLHEAFLDNLAPDAIAFVPLPAAARPAHENQPKTSAKLTWGPAWVAVSAAGDLALSTGPWKVEHHEETIIKVSTGIFFTVWRRQPDGSFKVAVDAGIASPLKFAMPATVQNGFAATAAKPLRPSDAANGRIGVTQAERVVDAAAKGGLGAAVMAQADPSIRAYREGQPAGIGAAAASALLSKDTRKMACSPERVVASASGDLGYVYGKCEGDGADSSSKYGFLRVWRLHPDGTWKLLVDITP
jgi:ketosteroid isomerase-like protein